jgi:hypothetical protein
MQCDRTEDRNSAHDAYLNDDFQKRHVVIAPLELVRIEVSCYPKAEIRKCCQKRLKDKQNLFHRAVSLPVLSFAR